MTHYIARIVVEKVEALASAPQPNVRRVEQLDPVMQRRKSTIANIVVGSEELDTLKEKTSAHLQLIEDGGDIMLERKTFRG